MIQWIMEHQVSIGVLVTAILDFVIAANPKLESNSLIHVLLSIFKKPAA